MYYIKLLRYSIYKTLRIIGRMGAIGVFFLLVVGVLYYYVKSDLPPQELRTILGEFAPAIQTYIGNHLPDGVFSFFEIDTSL